MNFNSYLKRGSIRQISGSNIIKLMYIDYLQDIAACERIIKKIRGNNLIQERTIRFRTESQGIRNYVSHISRILQTIIHLCRKVIYQDVIIITDKKEY